MAVHEINLPEGVPGNLLGGEVRSIIWDDEAGTVEGEHSLVPAIREILGRKKPATVGNPHWTWDLQDPGRDPAEMLIVLGTLYWPAVTNPVRVPLPAIFDDISIPPGEQRSALDDEAA